MSSLASRTIQKQASVVKWALKVEWLFCLTGRPRSSKMFRLLFEGKPCVVCLELKLSFLALVPLPFLRDAKDDIALRKEREGPPTKSFKAFPARGVLPPARSSRNYYRDFPARRISLF